METEIDEGSDPPLSMAYIESTKIILNVSAESYLQPFNQSTIVPYT